ncbi:penicillin-binding transpeptidase domain-containing protein, partial [Patescibacteria group bacterium]|nr:penicillin-binding transpeptidase domain-containing protein [Patescibacteria group bacterium]
DTKFPSGDPAKPEYEPVNYDGKFRGPMQLRFALGNSINTIAVKVSALVGIKDILKTANDMGITTLAPDAATMSRVGLSLTLGGGEVKLIDLASAYGVFATEGLRQDPVAILKVQDANGKVIYEHQEVSGRRVLDADVAYLVSSILSDNSARVEEFGPNSYLHIPGWTVAAKTGTTDDKRDNWTLGYTPSVVVGTWVGNNDNTPMNQSLASGITGAAPIWNRIMRAALAGKKDEPFVRPGDITEMDIDAYGGGLPVPGEPTRKEVFIKGTEPTAPSPIYQNVKVSKRDNNKLANAVEVARGEYDTKPYIIFKEQDPVSTDGKNRWQEGIDAWIATQSDPKFHPPTDTYQGSDQIGVSIRKPGDHDQVNSNDVEVRADIGTTNDITHVEIQVDGTAVKTEPNSSSFDDTITVPNGQHTISVRASDNKGNTSQADVHIGVNEPYATPTPTPQPTATPTPAGP